MDDPHPRDPHPHDPHPHDPLPGTAPTQQDRADFEHALGLALADPAVRAATAGDPRRAARLRALARQQAAPILAAAAPEYLAYRRLRDAAPAPPARATAPGERLTGWLGALALVVPVVSGSAAAVFFLLGAVLDLSHPHPGVTDALRTAAWSAVAVAVTGALTGLAGLLLTAALRRADPPADPRHAGQLAAARSAWRTALLERGLLPFLRSRPDA
ncbi:MULTISPECIES: hypothetical protein [Kitasatospora]|uniref:Transmembrane protein n=1 Tax=Kitasatospora setae (strain ATCC 33774 / DSM 43861 / JCM 3304 / KCC A-0304 / NBRC 14216 / KM-6054) TaxID=452652 RepID=E4NEE6_KITSK|nr:MULTISPECIES: hypothetical protein [Kitasatospora]BAJ29577.1 hypothetical protein KSE_37790 [Kitasatospora setae KM-6054]